MNDDQPNDDATPNFLIAFFYPRDNSKAGP